MKRLTGRKEDGCTYVIGCPEFEVPKGVNILLQAVVDRCADFEDIIEEGCTTSYLKELVKACEGLEPKEIDECKFMIVTRKNPEKMSRLREMVKADREGKCVVLPCKVGDTVYAVGSSKIVEATVKEIYFGEDGEIEVLITFTCDALCNGCPFERSKQNKRFCAGIYGELYVYLNKFEGSIFTTREVAEAALKERVKE